MTLRNGTSQINLLLFVQQNITIFDTADVVSQAECYKRGRHQNGRAQTLHLGQTNGLRRPHTIEHLFIELALLFVGRRIIFRLASSLGGVRIRRFLVKTLVLAELGLWLDSTLTTAEHMLIAWQQVERIFHTHIGELKRDQLVVLVFDIFLFISGLIAQTSAYLDLVVIPGAERLVHALDLLG